MIIINKKNKIINICKQLIIDRFRNRCYDFLFNDNKKSKIGLTLYKFLYNNNKLGFELFKYEYQYMMQNIDNNDIIYL